ncbi:hypothetical protein [Kitasatospora sp. NPDC008115]|uniref:hypothetical protein n=1 Tax=Kitasatospora sp. NPDC008115 TaxID=3364022 RepID=UPI0036EC1124
MAELVTPHICALDLDTLGAVRALLFEEFDDMSEEDREHGPGGVHAPAREGRVLVGHASVVQRRRSTRRAAGRRGAGRSAR